MASDGVALSGTVFKPKRWNRSGALVVCNARWDPAVRSALARALHERGFLVLALDVRGYGSPIGQVDPETSRALEDAAALRRGRRLDVEAGLRYLTESGGCDAKRIGAVAADAGCEILFRACRESPIAVKALACLHPTLPATADAEDAARGDAKLETPLLVVAQEWDRAAAESLLKRARSGRLVITQPRSTGSREWDIVCALGWAPFDLLTAGSFLSRHTGSSTDDVVLDGLVAEEAAEGRAWRRATWLRPATGTAWAYRVGDRLVFGGRTPVRTRFAHWQVWVADGVRLDTGAGGPSAVRRHGRLSKFRLDLRAGKVARASTAGPARESDDEPVDPSVGPPFTSPFVRIVRVGDAYEYEGEWSEWVGRTSHEDPMLTVVHGDDADEDVLVPLNRERALAAIQATIGPPEGAREVPSR